MRVTVVEDDPATRRVIELMLQKLGHEVSSYSNGEDALANICAVHSRMIISDWMMPKLDGLAFCSAIRALKNHPYTYFVLLTTRESTDENLDVAYSAGVDDFLNKPPRLPELKRCMLVADRIMRFTTHISRLERLVPICTYCKKIRDKAGDWQQLEQYIGEETGADFSHGICPTCCEVHIRPQLEALRRETGQESD